MVLPPGPHFSVADVCNGWTNAFRGLGVEVGALNFDDILDSYMAFHIRLADTDAFVPAFSYEDAVKMANRQILASAYQFLPEVAFIVSGFFCTVGLLDLFRARGTKTVVLCTESPYEDDKQVRFADRADVVLVNDPTNLEQFKTINPKSYYVPHAYDPQVHRPGKPSPELECDFGFCGTGYPSRVEFFEAVDWSGIDVKLAGMWKAAAGGPLEKHVIHPLAQCFDNSDTVDLYRSSKCSANLYRARDAETCEANRPDLAHGWAMGPREVELARTGTFFLREPRGEGDELFPMLPTFTEPDDFEEKLRWWLSRDNERETAARAARAAVADRTFLNHARWLLTILSK